MSFSLEWNGLKFVFGSDTYPNKWFVEYAKDADLAVHECFVAVPDLVKKMRFTPEQALLVGTQIHTVLNRAPPDSKTAVLPHKIDCTSNKGLHFGSRKSISSRTHVEDIARAMGVYKKWSHICDRTSIPVKGSLSGLSRARRSLNGSDGA